jgi:hypothetical protein
VHGQSVKSHFQFRNPLLPHHRGKLLRQHALDRHCVGVGQQPLFAQEIIEAAANMTVFSLHDCSRLTAMVAGSRSVQPFVDL